MSAADEERGAFAASNVDEPSDVTEVVAPVTDAEPSTVVDPAVAPEPIVASEAVTDKRPTFEAPETRATATISAPLPSSTPTSPTDERPELLVGAAFAGGLVAALILKRLGR